MRHLETGTDSDLTDLHGPHSHFVTQQFWALHSFMTVTYTEMVFYILGNSSAHNVGNLDQARTYVVNVVMRCAVAESGKELISVEELMKPVKCSPIFSPVVGGNTKVWVLTAEEEEEETECMRKKYGRSGREVNFGAATPEIIRSAPEILPISRKNRRMADKQHRIGWNAR